MKGRQSDNLFEVDEGTAYPPIAMTTGNFKKIEIRTSSEQSFVKSNLLVSVNPDHQIPQYGNIVIEYPAEVEFEDRFFSQSQCDDWVNFSQNSAVC